MNDVFIKKNWEEENILFYLHFSNKTAIRQIEVHSNEIRYLSESNPVYKDSILYDQSLETLDIEQLDYIDVQEFDSLWRERERP